jgi:orotidine-5'-phosphate decarboxylase
MNGGKDRLIVPLDVPTPEAALELVRELDGVVGFFKIGLELLMTGAMARVIDELRGTSRLFLDLKLPDDIPETIRRAVEVGTGLGADFLTLSAGVGPETIHAAVEGRGRASGPKLLYVSYLSSRDRPDLGEVDRRSDAALEAGCDGFIASGELIGRLRQRHPRAPIVSPGIRPRGAPKDDHKRSATPAEAIAAGADYLVVGRPIRDAADRRAAAVQIISEIDAALAGRG